MKTWEWEWSEGGDGGGMCDKSAAAEPKCKHVQRQRTSTPSGLTVVDHVAIPLPLQCCSRHRKRWRGHGEPKPQRPRTQTRLARVRARAWAALIHKLSSPSTALRYESRRPHARRPNEKARRCSPRSSSHSHLPINEADAIDELVSRSGREALRIDVDIYFFVEGESASSRSHLHKSVLASCCAFFSQSLSRRVLFSYLRNFSCGSGGGGGGGGGRRA